MARATIELQDFLANPFGVLEQARKTGWLADLNPATGVLARAELQEGLAALSTRLGCPTVGADAAWKPSVGINGPVRLPITFATKNRQ